MKLYAWKKRPVDVTAPLVINIKVGGSDTGTESIIIKFIRPHLSTMVLLVNPKTRRIALKDAYDLGMPSEDCWIAASNGMIVDCSKEPPEIQIPKETMLEAAGILVY